MSPVPSQSAVTVRRKSGYIPSLDGWRAIAILGVIWSHDLRSTLAGHSLLPYQNEGGSGVDLFFAISGILITTRILEEESLIGFFDIRKFYIRRIFRIQPAAWLYLAVIACLLASGSITMLWHHWFGAFGMYENFLYRGRAYDYQGFFVGHFWSLAVEEHFYILLSLFLLMVKRYRAAALACAFVGLMVLRAYAAAHGYMTDATWHRTYYQLPILIYAACCAVALQKENWRSRADRYLKPWMVFSATAAFTLGRELNRHLHSPSPGDFHPTSLLSAAGYVRTFFFAIWIVSTITHANALSTRSLSGLLCAGSGGSPTASISGMCCSFSGTTLRCALLSCRSWPYLASRLSTSPPSLPPRSAITS